MHQKKKKEKKKKKKNVFSKRKPSKLLVLVALWKCESSGFWDFVAMLNALFYLKIYTKRNVIRHFKWKNIMDIFWSQNWK